MKFIQGQDRDQTCLFPVSLNESIEADNEVRFIDCFVNSLPLDDFGFKTSFEENGRPAYHPGDLLKLFIYGYLNQERSSRQLEKECRRNIEIIWLLKNLRPDHNTISNFRRDNSKAIKQVFRETVRIAKNFNLIGARLVAGDSTKLRAQNSKKNNYNQKKIDRHLEYIERKLEEYNRLLAENDSDTEMIRKEIDKQKQRQSEYRNIERELNESDQAQISTTDPDSRHLITRNNITEVAYNVQTTVDAAHNIPIDYKVTNSNDSKAMGNMVRRTKAILRTSNFTALYDKGYHTGSEFAITDSIGVETIVAIPAIAGASKAPKPKYDVQNFKYIKESDCYLCPEGHCLKSNGTWYHAANMAYQFRQFKTPMCRTCAVQSDCTRSIRNGKIVQRSEYTSHLEANRQRVHNNEKTYKRRQAIVEHPFGTIKRQWGYSYIITKKSMERASADVGLIMTAYNLRRIINIIGKIDLIRLFRQINAFIINKMVNSKFNVSHFELNRLIIRDYSIITKKYLIDARFNKVQLLESGF